MAISTIKSGLVYMLNTHHSATAPVVATTMVSSRGRATYKPCTGWASLVFVWLWLLCIASKGSGYQFVCEANGCLSMRQSARNLSGAALYGLFLHWQVNECSDYT